PYRPISHPPAVFLLMDALRRLAAVTPATRNVPIAVPMRRCHSPPKYRDESAGMKPHLRHLLVECQHLLAGGRRMAGDSLRIARISRGGPESRAIRTSA